MKQPYIYTMPEEFLSDKGVPARWKVLATVQGFWIAGKTLYATNEWIQKKLSYSRRQVQYALSELEKMDLVTRSVHGKNRIILPGGCNRTAPMGATGLRSKGAVGLHHNSVSNSVSIISASRKNMKIRGYNDNNPQDDLPTFDVDSGDMRVPEPPRSKSASYKALLKWAEDMRGFPFLPGLITKQYKAFSMASAAKLSGADLKRRWIEMKDDKYWGAKGFDWMDVVISFNKKGK